MDRYEVVRQVGRGAFGRALLVRHKHQDDPRLYVIKQISLPQLSALDQDASRKEVAVLSKLKHPNIVTFYKSFYDSKQLCILMEFCDAGDLMNRIKIQRGRPFIERQIVDWLVQICLGLKHIHDRKILHRDIKTQNIFLSHGGLRVKLGDFGIARVLNSTMELVKTCVGTPYYLSPEICQNRPYNNKTDIWALGCVLYELCALRHPFEGSNLRQLVLRICRGRYDSVPQNYSSDLRLTLHSLLKVSPCDRPSVSSLLRRPLLLSHVSRLLDAQMLEEELCPKDLPRCSMAVPEASRSTDKHEGVLKPPIIRPHQRLDQKWLQDPEQQVKSRGPHPQAAAEVSRPAVDPLRRWRHLIEPPESPKVPEDPQHIAPAPLEPFRLVAAAREEYLQRRHEAFQYKLRAQKQLGLRPSTADAEESQRPHSSEKRESKAPQRRERGREEYLQQLQRIREQYHHDVRQMRKGPEDASDADDTRRETRAHRRHRQKGIMFEIKLNDDQYSQRGKSEEETESEHELLNNTLTFTEADNLQIEPIQPHTEQEEEECVMKRGRWCRDLGQTLLNALERMNMTDSIADASLTVPQQEIRNRKHWENQPSDSLALAETTDSCAGDEGNLTEEESDEEEEHPDSHSDDEDTIFEDSEDELRAEIRDSMRNLLTTLEQEQEVHNTVQEVANKNLEDPHATTNDDTEN